MVDFSQKRFGPAFTRLLQHYFPGYEPPIGLGSRLKFAWQNLDWRWWYRLRPLLWPGWLGPVLVLGLAWLIILLFRSAGTEALTVQPTPEKLSVIPFTVVTLPEIEKEVRLIDGKVMVSVPGGEFVMGSSESDPLADDDEWPEHTVYVDGFWIDKTEVTNAEYQRCVDVGGCSPQRHQGNSFAESDQPVVGVDWFQANTYCEWAGGRLPTEAEWEKAARGTDGRIYPWGNKFDGTRLNYCDANCIQDWKDRSANDGFKYTAPVGSYPAGASPYGVLDMSGNVWEWTADWYDEDYYELSGYHNPTGPSTGQQRVIRGGAWHYAGRNLRVPNRHKDTPSFRYDKIGFRCVVSDHASAQVIPGE